jgi:hypothetical protein
MYQRNGTVNESQFLDCVDAIVRFGTGHTQSLRRDQKDKLKARFSMWCQPPSSTPPSSPITSTTTTPSITVDEIITDNGNESAGSTDSSTNTAESTPTKTLIPSRTLVGLPTLEKEERLNWTQWIEVVMKDEFLIDLIGLYHFSLR